MVVKGLRFCLVILWALAVQRPDAYAHQRSPGCEALGGECIIGPNGCPPNIPLQTTPGKPFCPKQPRQGCCYPKNPQCFPATWNQTLSPPYEYGICAYTKPRGKKPKWRPTKFVNFCIDSQGGCQSFVPPKPCNTETCWVGDMRGVCAPVVSPPTNWIYQGIGYGCNDDPCECYTPKDIGWDLYCKPGFFSPKGSTQCFKLFRGVKGPWSNAKVTCEDAGLRMAKPFDFVTAIALRKYIIDTYGSVEVWLSAQGDGSKIVWSDNTELRKDNLLWWPGHPDQLSNNWCLTLLGWRSDLVRHPGRPYAVRHCQTPLRPQHTLCEDEL